MGRTISLQEADDPDAALGADFGIAIVDNDDRPCRLADMTVNPETHAIERVKIVTRVDQGAGTVIGCLETALFFAFYPFQRVDMPFYALTNARAPAPRATPVDFIFLSIAYAEWLPAGAQFPDFLRALCTRYSSVDCVLTP